MDGPISGSQSIPVLPAPSSSAPLENWKTMREELLSIQEKCPKLSEITDAKILKQTFIQKCNICTIHCSMSHYEDKRYIEAKRDTLKELVTYVVNYSESWSEELFKPIVVCLEANLCRDLPPSANGENFDPTEDDPALDPSWVYLEKAYILGLRIIYSTQLSTKVAKACITENFVQGILRNFNSEDPRERDYSKNILYKIYGKLVCLRATIRRGIRDVFITFIYENEFHNGIADLLDLLLGIVAGFAVPLKAEHRSFFYKALIPLHFSKSYGYYCEQLKPIIMQYVKKEPPLAATIITELLTHWPKHSCTKEVLFLDQIESILESMENDDFEIICHSLFKKLSCTIMSSHFQVATRALMILNNEALVRLFGTKRAVILPIIFRGLYLNSNEHWNETVQTMSKQIMEAFMNMDLELFKECYEQYVEDKRLNEEKRKHRNESWKKIRTVADRRLSALSVSSKSRSTSASSDNSDRHSSGANSYNSDLFVYSEDENEVDTY